MGITGITLFRLVTATLLPVVVTVMFYFAHKKTKFENVPYMWKQTIFGVTFGIIAILATEFGIPVDGAVLNVRNAAPLTAGLVFGWPAGIISGVIGGVERWFTDAGDYTRIACSISTLLAGFVGAGVRKFMNDDKKANWFYGLAVGITMEVFHMLMVFITNSDDIQRAFEVVQICAIPMITANSVSVMLSIVAITVLVKLNKNYIKKEKEKENIAQTFRRRLLICVILAFAATTLFSHSFQTNVAYQSAEVSLRNTLEDISNDINNLKDESDRSFLNTTRRIGNDGRIIICDSEGYIISDRETHEGEHISIYGDASALKTESNTCIKAEMNGEDSLIMYTQTKGYYIIGIISEDEAFFSKRASIYMLAFMEMLVFAALFAMIFMLIKRLVVRNIRKINESLNQITNGDLEIKVDVRDNEEFASLSDDINSTVSTLKHYIDEAAARFDKDLEIAKKIQNSALPSVFPPYPNRKDFSIFASMYAAKEVGGDFYDFYMLDENHIAFVIADVSGKGIPGAMFMMTSKTLIKGHAESGLPINEVFNQVNKQLCENNEAEMFVTAWLGVLNLKTGLIKYVNAGHNPPLIRHKNGTYEYLRGKANFVLAGMEGIKYREQEIQLQPGDEIYLYTDGITEAHNENNQLFGEKRLLDSLNSTQNMTVDEICQKVKSDVDEFVGSKEQFDDITMLCIRLNEVEEMIISLNPTMESMSEAAKFVEENLEKLEVPMKYTMKLMVAIDEIYSNIIRYSGATEAQIKINKDGNEVKIAFIDNGKPYNPLEAETPDITASVEDRKIGGLGIHMVRNMMDNTEYMHLENKNILTITLEI